MEKTKNLLQTIRENDFVEYYLFPQLICDSEKEQENFLNKLLTKVNKVINKYAQGYLWHKDPLKLTPRTGPSNLLNHFEEQDQVPPHLHGVTHYGDNIEDEWFIVFLMQEVTKEIPGTVAKLYDSDGEFLLIEAADLLPEWASPETCENRVYLYEGSLHLLQPSDMQNPHLSVQEALNFIWMHPDQSIAPQNIQNCIYNKLSLYPDNIKNNFHHATVYVPTAVAALLHARPDLISGAVQAFCNRDPVDVKACRAMKYFPPEQRVRARVKFNKCLYAMLLHSKYLPDRKTGWNLPSSTSAEYKEHNLGVRIACGFEILASQAKPSEDINGDRGWMQYLKSLQHKGYFQELLEGSKDYNSRLSKAKEYYKEHRDSMYYSPAVGREIMQLLRTIEIDYSLLKAQGETLPPDDDASWLNISPDELEKMLQERYGQRKMFNVNESTDPAPFTDKLNTFLNHRSDVDGVEFPSDHASPSPTKPPRGKKKEVSFATNDNQNNVNFDPNSFADALQNILNLVIPDDLGAESDSDMSEYENDEFVKNGDAKMQKYMEEMDKELSNTTIGKSFEKTKSTDTDFDDVESFQSVDINVNALKNILESYRSQLGDAGPSSNMLGPMGVHLDSKR